MNILELCSGAGGQAIGLEMAGFEHVALIENDPYPCKTVLLNRPHWNVIEKDLREVNPKDFKNVDVICGGVPCQPFSVASKQLGHEDERDLFPEAIRFVAQIKPKFFFFENVKGFSTSKFEDYRNEIIRKFNQLGYYTEWKVINSSDYGVPQLRPRFILVGRRDGEVPFPWPKPHPKVITVGEALAELLGKNGWKQVKEWKKLANKVAPTIVGGSKKHGGADLGPSRARKAWLAMGIKGTSLGDAPPEASFVGTPKLTNEMVARIQGFPQDWKFFGGKTAINRQIGNAFPPPVAYAIGKSIIEWSKMKPTSKKVSVPQRQREFNISMEATI